VPLQRTQQNEVLAAVQAADLDPGEFSWLPGSHYQGSQARLVHQPSDFYFNFIFGGNTWQCVFEPGDGVPRSHNSAGSWYQEMQDVARWLYTLRDEVQAPDLWAELDRERNALAQPNAGDTENTPFSPDELARISEQIAELKEYVRNAYELGHDQQRVLEARLDYVEHVAQDGMGRVDWWNLFAGALVNLVLTQIVPPGVVQALLVLAVQGLAGLFGGGMPELPAGPIAPV